MNFSWFYCDLISKDDTKIVIVFYDQPFFLSFDNSLVDVCIYNSGGKHHFGFPAQRNRSDFQIEPPLSKISACSLQTKDDSFLISIENDRLTIDLTLKPLFSYWQPQVTPLFQKGDDRFVWKIMLPRGKASGFYELDGGRHPISGEAYLDYNEGSGLLNRHLDSWYWARLHSSERTLVLGALYFKDNKLYQPAWMFDPVEAKFSEPEKSLFSPGGKINFDALEDFPEANQIPPENFDRVNFLLSKIKPTWILPRKIHEFLFYQLDERAWGRGMNRLMANVLYERSVLSFSTEEQENFYGILEYIQFK